MVTKHQTFCLLLVLPMSNYTLDFNLQFTLDPDLYKYNWFTLMEQRPHYAKSVAFVAAIINHFLILFLSVQS